MGDSVPSWHISRGYTVAADAAMVRAKPRVTESWPS
jgi:hypothetical protein